jgi:predicted AlkP superfamily pyrophosphatase or phosphodiesterase
MHARFPVTRVVLVVLDGLRPDAVDAFDLRNLRRLARAGAFTPAARTVAPSVTAAATASLFTGVHPERHGIQCDRFGLPRGVGGLDLLTRTLAQAGHLTAAFAARVPWRWRWLARQLARAAGVQRVGLRGADAAGILADAAPTLRERRPGLVFLHWPDADRAGHAHGWMSPEYGAAARALDGALGELAGLAGVPADPGTLLIALADHGGGGLLRDDHDSDHPADRTIPILLAGGGAAPCRLRPDAHLVDVPATVLWALGVPVPASFAGRPLAEAFDALSTAA